MHGINLKLYLAAFIACVSVNARAQTTDADDVIAACARIAAVGDRILCLENAVRGMSDETASAPTSETPGADNAGNAAQVAVDREAEPEPQETGGDPVTGAEVETAASTVADYEPAASPETATEVTTATTSAVTSAPTIKAEVVSDSATEDDEIGAEQVRARAMSQEERLAALDSAENLRVASYSKVPFEKLVVELENGQVWRQIKGDVQKIRVNLRRNQTVSISESRFGGYQLRLNEIQRTIRVQRIR